MKTINPTDRNWPLPSRPPFMRMTWHDLLFMHYPFDREALQSLIPYPLQVDTFDGSAWIGLVPFRMTGVAHRLSPNIPYLSSFPELNVRTYVTVDGKPGVWFFSLEANNWLAIRIARRFFHLNYMDAKIDFQLNGDPTGKWIRFKSNRTHHRQPDASFQIEYRPIGPTFHASPGSLEEFLTSRYCLYTANEHNEVFRGEIDHAPWELRDAQVIIAENRMTEALGLKLPNSPPLLHYSKTTQAIAWSLEKISDQR